MNASIFSHRLKFADRRQQQAIETDGAGIFRRHRTGLSEFSQGLDQASHPGGQIERFVKRANIVLGRPRRGRGQFQRTLQARQRLVQRVQQISQRTSPFGQNEICRARGVLSRNSRHA
jgi:ribosomal protein S11